MPSIRRRAFAASVLFALGPVPVAAQTAPQNPPTTIPGLEKFSLSGTPTPTPTSTPSPTPTPTFKPAGPTPEPVATPSPDVVPRARPIPAPIPTLAPDTEETPDEAASIAPSAAPPHPSTWTPTQAAPIPQASTETGCAWPWWLAGGALALLGGWLALRRRPEPKSEVYHPSEPVAAASPSSPAPRARLAVDLRPTRAGLNLLSATVDCEVRVTNTGGVPAEGVRVGVRLFSAHAGQDAELAAFHDQPVVRPATPSFALAAGETRAVRAVAALPRADIRPLDAGRSMFVPVLAVNVLYRSNDVADGQTAQAFAVGVERAGNPKLAPFRLDQPPRTVAEVAARAHAGVLER